MTIVGLAVVTFERLSWRSSTSLASAEDVRLLAEEEEEIISWRICSVAGVDSDIVHVPG